ncbi:MAG: SEC-C domain-containing protein [Chloroflexi bacterium]|nr:SEC-C domain-containing protein [Chloroflexota bacterium]
MALGDLKVEASRPQIEALFRQHLAAHDFISLADYQDQMKPGARSLADVDEQFDVIAFYQHLHALQKHTDHKALRQGLLQDQGFLPPAPAARPFQTRVGDWLNAKIAPAPKPAKIGRNVLCPCGSGLKYKKCHGKAGAPPLK